MSENKVLRCERIPFTNRHLSEIRVKGEVYYSDGSNKPWVTLEGKQASTGVWNTLCCMETAHIAKSMLDNPSPTDRALERLAMAFYAAGSNQLSR